MKKVLGYVFAGLGLIGLAANSIEGLKSIPVLGSLVGSLSIVVSLVLVGLGVAVLVVLGKKKGRASKADEEVPIYEGDKIVGYRRDK